MHYQLCIICTTLEILLVIVMKLVEVMITKTTMKVRKPESQRAEGEAKAKCGVICKCEIITTNSSTPV